MAAKVAKRTKTTEVEEEKTYDSIEAELLDVTGAKPQNKRKEDRDAYLTRLATDVEKYYDSFDDEDANKSDDEFAKLSKGAQDWFEKAAKALSKDKVPGDFADANNDDNDDDEGEETVTKIKRPASKKAKTNNTKKTTRSRRDPDAKYKVNPEYSAREGTMMETLVNQAKTLRSFTRDQLVDASKKKLTEQRARRFIAWSLANDVFIEA